MIGTNVWRSIAARHVQIEEMTIAATNLSRAMAQHSNDTFKEADTTLIGMVERIERLHRSLVERVAQLPQLNGLFIYDKDGRWVVNSQVTLDTHYNNADREYFQYHLAHTDQGPHIGAPVKSRSTGRWIIPVSRRIDAPDDSFAGVALAIIDVSFFTHFYDSLDLGQKGTTTLVGNDGVMVVRRPFEDRFVGKRVVDTTMTALISNRASRAPSRCRPGRTASRASTVIANCRTIRSSSPRRSRATKCCGPGDATRYGTPP